MFLQKDLDDRQVISLIMGTAILCSLAVTIIVVTIMKLMQNSGFS